MSTESEGWEIISSKTCFEDKNVAVVEEEIRSPERREPRKWTVVRRKRAVIIAPMTADGKLILIRQERIPVRAAIWEVPGGQIDEEGEPAFERWPRLRSANCAKRPDLSSPKAEV